MSIINCRKVLLLSREERTLCIHAVFWLLKTFIYLKVFPYQRVLIIIRKQAEKPVIHPSDRILSADYICVLIEKCARNLPIVLTCLPQALAGYVICRKYGYKTKLRIGARKAPSSGFRAHAWLEFEGRIIMGNLMDIKSYAVFENESNSISE